MKDTFARNAKTHRASIEDLPMKGYELPDEHLQKASGGMPIIVICGSYEPASCLVGGGTDYRRID